MSGRRSRSKGARGEREARDVLQALWPLATRGKGQTHRGSDAADVEGTPFWVEVKRTKNRPNVHAAFEQAREATDGRPVCVLSRKDNGEWLLTVRFADVLEAVL